MNGNDSSQKAHSDSRPVSQESDGSDGKPIESGKVANGFGGEEIAWVSKRLQAHRQLSSSDSWGSEDFESYSSNDEEGGCRPNSGRDEVQLRNNESSMLNSSKISTDSKISETNV